MQNPCRTIGLLGISIVAMSIVLTTVYPSTAPYMPAGFSTPIIAFEFIRTSQEVQQFFGAPNSPERETMVRAIDLGNYLDFIYMLLYSLFLFLFLIKCTGKTRTRDLYVRAGFVPLVLIGDFLENVQLLRITAKLQTGNFENELYYLNIFTWQKWGGIAFIFLLLTPYFLQGNLYTKFIGIFAIIPCILGILAYFHRSVLNELMSLSVAIMFALIIIYCFIVNKTGKIHK